MALACMIPSGVKAQWINTEDAYPNGKVVLANSFGYDYANVGNYDALEDATAKFEQAWVGDEGVITEIDETEGFQV